MQGSRLLSLGQAYTSTRRAVAYVMCGRRAGIPRGVLEAPLHRSLRMVNILREVLAPLFVQMAKKIA
ncbi:unnamed protein product [Victoria cruziana]